MGIREKINSRPAVSAGVVAGVILCAIVAILLMRPSGPTRLAPGEAAYTTDGGASWFKDTDDRIIPFDYRGKPAVGAALFSSDGGKTKYVGYVYRYGAVVDAKGKAWPDRLAKLPGAEATEIRNTLQVKPPSAPDKAWVLASTPEGNAVSEVKSSDGKPVAVVEP